MGRGLGLDRIHHIFAVTCHFKGVHDGYGRGPKELAARDERDGKARLVDTFALFSHCEKYMQEPSRRAKRDSGMFKASSYKHWYIASVRGDEQAISLGHERLQLLPDATRIVGTSSHYHFRSSNELQEGGNMAVRRMFCACDSCLNEEHADCKHHAMTGGRPQITTISEKKVSARAQTRTRLIKDFAGTLIANSLVAVGLAYDENGERWPFAVAKTRTAAYKVRIGFSQAGVRFKKGTWAIDATWVHQVGEPDSLTYRVSTRASDSITVKVGDIVRVKLSGAIAADGGCSISEDECELLLDAISMQ